MIEMVEVPTRPNLEDYELPMDSPLSVTTTLFASGRKQQRMVWACGLRPDSDVLLQFPGPGLSAVQITGTIHYNELGPVARGRVRRDSRVIHY